MNTKLEGGARKRAVTRNIRKLKCMGGGERVETGKRQELPVGLSNFPSALQPCTDNNEAGDLYKHPCHYCSKNNPHWNER